MEPKSNFLGRKIRIHGWFCTSLKYPDLSKNIVDPEVYKYSVRDFFY